MSYAQSNTLEQCLKTLNQTVYAINQSRVPNQQALFPTLDPTYQKYKQSWETWSDCVKGHKAPLTAFQTLEGEFYDSAALSGKILVINFWSTSCAPCVAEMPALNKLVKDYQGRNVLFIGFAGDRAASLTPTYFQKHPFAFKVVAEARPHMLPFYSNVLPTTYIVDQQGVIQKAWVGNEMDQTGPYYKAKSVIDELLTAVGK
ncbi:hypothetical protein GCM10028773_30740 [Spirosoma koreense]